MRTRPPPRSPFAQVALVLCAALPLTTGCSGSRPAEQGALVVDRAPGCHPLGLTDECLFPFPSAYNEVDAPTATGVRWRFPEGTVPTPVSGDPLDLGPYEKPDGAPPTMPILLHLPAAVDTSGLPGIDSIERSMQDDSLVALFDLETGLRAPFFVEMDANVKEGFEGRNAFIVRPVAPLEMGHRHAVFVKKGLADVAGVALEPTTTFGALRDGELSNNPEVEALRPRMDEVFALGDARGYPRDELVLAWDFQVASEEWLLGPVKHIREVTLSEVGETGLGYFVESTEDDPNEDVARIVYGQFEVPSFLAEDDEARYDDQHLPIRQAANRYYPFTLVIPKKAEQGPQGLVVLGHGIFGEGRDFIAKGGDSRELQRLLNENGVVGLATDWIGLSSDDLPRIADEVATNLNRVGLITDQLEQSLANVLTMTKLGKGGLRNDPITWVGDGPSIDPTRIYYWGASLGGIQGTSFISLSPDIPRAVFGVPGSAWSTMLTRSIVFSLVKTFIEFDYPDALDLTVITTLAQVRFDHTDPANVGQLLLKRPLPGSPPFRQVLLQEAIGDSQVPNLATDILARAIGVKLLSPSFYAPWGLEPVSAPTTDSVLVQYRLPDFDQPLPPRVNLAPDQDNGVHHEMNFLPNVHQQIGTFLLEGVVELYCDDTCDPD